jgi:hypothetical protein
VYATEVADDKLDDVKSRMAADGIDNVTTILKNQQKTKLAAGCCDRMLLRLVYHHFVDFLAMRRDLWVALRFGGQIAVIDVSFCKSWPAVEGVPDRGGYGIEAEDLLAEMRVLGFEVVVQHEPGRRRTELLHRVPPPHQNLARNRQQR